MTELMDLTGKRFDRWLVLGRSMRKSRAVFWNCRCDCGTEREVAGNHIRNGHTKSCGCLCLEINAKRLKGNQLGKIHGLHDHPLRAIRKAMIRRCGNPNDRFFKNYGGRGIIVCDEWKESLVAFYEWAIDNGWFKGLSIDRINNDGKYEPKNCRWITVSENSRRPRSWLKHSTAA